MDGPTTKFHCFPHLVGQVLEHVSEDFGLSPQVSLLQYVDDLLLSGLTKKEVTDATISLLNLLGQ
jgi:hypothetical protein